MSAKRVKQDLQESVKKARHTGESSFANQCRFSTDYPFKAGTSNVHMEDLNFKKCCGHGSKERELMKHTGLLIIVKILTHNSKAPEEPSK